MYSLLHHAKSSLFEKLTPDLRKTLDRAIIDRTPATYRALFEHFKLREHGVSFAALCRYAKRIRDASTLGRVAECISPDAKETEKLIPRIVAQQLIDTLFEPNPSSRAIHRLADAYRMASKTADAPQTIPVPDYP